MSLVVVVIRILTKDDGTDGVERSVARPGVIMSSSKRVIA